MAEPLVLAERDWTARAENHRARVAAFTAAHRGRAHTGERHPVWDFLFTYYSLRPRQLMVWHPGYGTALAGAAARDYLQRAGALLVAPDATIQAVERGR